MSRARGSTEAADLGWEGQSGENSVIEASPETAFQEVVTAPQCPIGFSTAKLSKSGFNKEEGVETRSQRF